jgi:hypothetical protein
MQFQGLKLGRGRGEYSSAFYYDVMERDPDNLGKYRPAKMWRSFEEIAGNVGPGWAPILDDLFVKLFHIGWDGNIQQIKEKFGDLRLYLGCNLTNSVAIDIFDDLVEAAEARSSRFCERCGEPGRHRGSGWILTLCASCAVEDKYPLTEWELEELVKTGVVTAEKAATWPLLKLRGE